MNSKSLNNVEGFTLLEMLIAMAMLVFISLAIYQATTETFKLRDVLGNEGDFYNGIRLSMEILQRDVNALYSPIQLIPPKKAAADPGNPDGARGGDPTSHGANVNQQIADDSVLTTGELSQASTYWGAAVDASGLRPSRFIGTTTKLSFISASHIRVYKDAVESDFAKVTYELQKDVGNRDNPDSSLLVKSESTNNFDPDAEGDRDKARRVFPLLHGVKKLSFRFYRKDKDKWEEREWDTDKEEFKNVYPDIIQVVVEVVGPSRLSFDGRYSFRPEGPLRALNPSF